MRLGQLLGGRWWVVGRVRGRTLVVDLLGHDAELPRGARAEVLDDSAASAPE